MNWLRENRFHARPIVAVEDHVYHISEFLRALRRFGSEALANLTVVCLDRAGPDTDAAVDEWLQTCPKIQIACRISKPDQFEVHSNRVLCLSDEIFKNQNAYCRQIAELIRQQGLLLQDIELETLEFVPRDRWWESTMLASTVRGIVGKRGPRCAFISNKRGYEATFGAELLAAGHDPRDVLNKFEMVEIVIPFLNNYLEKHFPYSLQWVSGESNVGGKTDTCRVSPAPAERELVESQLDVVLWPQQDQTFEIGGQAMVVNKKSPLILAAEGNEIETWRQLILARLESLPGVEVQSVGQRVAPMGALRAEVTNAAARHIHALRKRLTDSRDIVTVAGHYRLRDGLSVGLAQTAN